MRPRDCIFGISTSFLSHLMERSYSIPLLELGHFVSNRFHHTSDVVSLVMRAMSLVLEVFGVHARRCHLYDHLGFIWFGDRRVDDGDCILAGVDVEKSFFHFGLSVAWILEVLCF